MDRGENYIIFKISMDGEVSFSPEMSTWSTSHEMQLELERIKKRLEDYLGSLLRERWEIWQRLKE